MTAEGSRDQFRLGFLTAIETTDRGYVGGLLVTNHFGRPLEFQCTAPVKPNRTQEILYGPTLVPFVLGELIGRTLVEKVGIKPHLVLTERPELLDVRAHVNVPVACVDAREVARRAVAIVDQVVSAVKESTGADTAPGENVDSTTEDPAPKQQEISVLDAQENGMVAAAAASLDSVESTESQSPNNEITLGRQMLRFHSAHPGDRRVLETSSRLIPEDADLREPFERVREALLETVRLGAIK